MLRNSIFYAIKKSKAERLLTTHSMPFGFNHSSIPNVPGTSRSSIISNQTIMFNSLYNQHNRHFTQKTDKNDRALNMLCYELKNLGLNTEEQEGLLKILQAHDSLPRVHDIWPGIFVYLAGIALFPLNLFLANMIIEEDKANENNIFEGEEKKWIINKLSRLQTSARQNQTDFNNFPPKQKELFLDGIKPFINNIETHKQNNHFYKMCLDQVCDLIIVLIEDQEKKQYSSRPKF